MLMSTPQLSDVSLYRVWRWSDDREHALVLISERLGDPAGKYDVGWTKSNPQTT